MEKVNYNRKFNEILAGLSSRPTLLLHVCCAPCFSGVINRVENNFDVTLYYYNPNIKPKSEYDKRLREIEKYIALSGRNIKIIDGGYDENAYYSAIGNFEKIEGGQRCDTCCSFRAFKAASAAAKMGFDYFCTTLTVSPHKNADEINSAMIAAGKEYGVKPLLSDFKKEGGFLTSTKESEKYGIYRQKYCGCSPRPFTVHLTGGIASGKSELTGILNSLGAYTISADEVSHRLSAEGEPLNDKMKELFPSAVDGDKLDRSAVKEIVFNDSQKLLQLNTLTHTAIKREIDRLIAASDNKIVVVEIPLLFESGWGGADVTVTVSADQEVRRRRAEMRDGISGEMFDLIAAKQMTDAQREALADITIYNSGDKEALTSRAKELYNTWLKNV